VRREWCDMFKVLKGRNLQPRIQYPVRLSFRIEGEIKYFPAKVKGAYPIKRASQEMLKVIL